MTTDSVGLYVHIPFCIRKCNYCDFCSFSVDVFAEREVYIDTLISEIRSYKDKNLKLNSIFFGGGTPTLLSLEEFEKIAEAIKETFEISAEAEFTIEANPKTLTEQKLLCYKSFGVNRISLGLQSIHENELKFLGRIHSYEDFLSSYNLVRKVGIANVNIDLMYGIPEQTKESFEETIARVLSLSPEHISLYSLIIEEGTPFFEWRENLPLPCEDEECDMYYTADKLLSDNGYSHYEISNYAKAGFSCQHNLKYWIGEEYIGVGVSAYSYFNGVRFGNARSLSEYLCNYLEKYDIVKSDREVMQYDFVMLRLRLADGFLLSEYKKRFGSDFFKEHEKVIKRYIDSGLMRLDGDKLSLTVSGFYVSNAILTELL